MQRVRPFAAVVGLNFPNPERKRLNELAKKVQRTVSAVLVVHLPVYQPCKVIFLYSQGVSTRDIHKTMQEMYGIDVDDSRVSKITDKILPLIREWQESPLQNVYAIIILDAVQLLCPGKRHRHEESRLCGYRHRSRRQKGCTRYLDRSERIYEILVIGSQWVEKAGGADILIASIDGFGFIETINTAYPRTEVQRCIIHQKIRSSTRYVSYKDIKQFTADLRPIYRAPVEETSPTTLDEF